MRVSPAKEDWQEMIDPKTPTRGVNECKVDRRPRSHFGSLVPVRQLLPPVKAGSLPLNGGGVSSGGTTSTTVTIAKVIGEVRRDKRTAATNAGLVADVVSTERSVRQEAALLFFPVRQR